MAMTDEVGLDSDAYGRVQVDFCVNDASGGLLEIIYHPNFPSIRTFDTSCCC